MNRRPSILRIIINRGMISLNHQENITILNIHPPTNILQNMEVKSGQNHTKKYTRSPL
jgi:hypothetical protein